MINKVNLVAWHFLPDDGALRYGARIKVKPGEVLKLPRGEKPELCARGFHASERAIDALQYAPGALVCRVELSGAIVRGDNKVAASSRKVLWMADATTTLHEFACDVAEQALNRWEERNNRKVDPRSRAAVEAKREWLRGEIDDAALAAARAAAWDAARYAARYAAWDAAWDAARDAALAAARAAAWDAARDAAEAAARAAAWAAALAAAEAAALEEMNADLTQRLEALAPNA